MVIAIVINMFRFARFANRQRYNVQQTVIIINMTTAMLFFYDCNQQQ
jgi:hypothetical protein